MRSLERSRPSILTPKFFHLNKLLFQKLRIRNIILWIKSKESDLAYWNAKIAKLILKFEFRMFQFLSLVFFFFVSFSNAITHRHTHTHSFTFIFWPFVLLHFVFHRFLSLESHATNWEKNMGNKEQSDRWHSYSVSAFVENKKQNGI